jgi:uncharacterized membrane protein
MYKYAKYRSVFLGIVFIIFGICVFLFGHQINQGLPKEVKVVLSVFLILYGLYRVIRGLPKAIEKNVK